MNLFSKLTVLLGCLAVFLPATDLYGSDSGARLQESVHRMEFWLGTGPDAKGWRQALLLNHLDTQSALGDRADLGQLQLILQRFEMPNVDGLDHPAFVDVRESIKRHVAFLSARNVVDVKSALAQAKYQPIPRASVEEYRDIALNQYHVLVEYYRSKMSSRERASLFYELKTDEAIELLSSMDMELLMPEIELDIDFGADVGDSESDDEEKVDKKKLRTEWLTRLREISRALSDKNLKLNDPYFASTQIAVDRLIRMFFYATDENAEKTFDRELNIIRTHFDSLADPAARGKHALVGNSLGWMQSTQQLPNVISVIRAKHSLPNFYANVSSNLINQIASRPIQQTQRVNEMVLGRLIRGLAHTSGSVSMDLIDDPNQANISIHMLANLSSDTHSGQGTITAYTQSGGTLEARRSVFANVAGFFAQDAYAAANVGSSYLGVNKTLKIINKIAYKTYLRDKTRAEGIAAGRAEKRVLNQFTEETDNALAQGDEKFAELVARVEPYAKLIPEAFLRTTYSDLIVTAHKANQFDLAANDTPAPSFVHPDLGIQLHETFLTNYLTPLFSGKTMSNQDMADRVLEFGGTPPAGLEPEKESDQFSITFATVQPIKIELDGDRLGVSIFGRRFSQAGRVIRAGLIITLRFKIVRENGALYLVKDGESEIEYGENVVKTARVATFKNFLQEKLNETGANDVKIELPPNLIPLDDLGIDDHNDILKNLKLVQFSSSNGWLQVGWGYHPGQSSFSTDTPSIEESINIQAIPQTEASGNASN